MATTHERLGYHGVPTHVYVASAFAPVERGWGMESPWGLVLAISLVRDGVVADPLHYVRGPMANTVSGDLTFGTMGMDLSIEGLLKLKSVETKQWL